MKSISDFRISYSQNELSENNVLDNPFMQFDLWFKEAVEAKIKEPNAMVLSTIKDGRPSARVVLLKGYDNNGFSFYTNYNSHKGLEMSQTPFASLTFFWDALERQVRINGRVDKVSETESTNYFNSRPRGSQIGAWVSEQSTVIENRDLLEERLNYFENKFKNEEIIPKPSHWGGYLVQPEEIEFWQGRESRIHDRILYTHLDRSWDISRLSP